MPKKMAEHLSDSMCIYIYKAGNRSDRMPNTRSDRMPNTRSDRMRDRMSNEMSEYM